MPGASKSAAGDDDDDDDDGRHLTAAAASNPSRLEKTPHFSDFRDADAKVASFLSRWESLFAFSSKSGSVRDWRRRPATNKTFFVVLSSSLPR